MAALAAVGGGLMIGGALLPWLTVYAGLDTLRGIDGVNGRILLAAGVLAVAVALAYAWRPSLVLRSTLGLVGFASAGFGAWVVAQLLGSYKDLGTDVFAVPSLGAGAFLALGGGVCVLATLLVPRAEGVAAHANGAAEARSIGDVRSIMVAATTAFLLSAGMIHLAVVGPHLSESTLFAAFFVAAGIAQIAAALVLTIRPYHRLLVALAVGNALVIVVWAISRTVGLPFGPTPGVAEDVSLPDVLATVAEAIVVMLAIALAWRARKVITVNVWVARAGAGAAVVAAAAVTVVAVIGVQAGGG